MCEGRPKKGDHYRIMKFDGLTLHVSNTLDGKKIIIDRAGFLRWKWLTVKER